MISWVCDAFVSVQASKEGVRQDPTLPRHRLLSKFYRQPLLGKPADHLVPHQPSLPVDSPLPKLPIAEALDQALEAQAVENPLQLGRVALLALDPLSVGRPGGLSQGCTTSCWGAS